MSSMIYIFLESCWIMKESHLSFLKQGMVHAAVYIKKKIKDERLLSQAFGRDLVS